MATKRAKTTAKDLTRDAHMHLRQCHWSKADPFNPQFCAVALAAKDAGWQDVRVLRNVVYLYDGKRWYRGMAGGAAKVIAALIDKGNAKKTKLPAAGLSIVIHAPKGVRTLAYKRGEDMAEVRRRSAKARKDKTRRTYRRTDGISLQDIRNGAGRWV